jgi:hypothetical protein
MIEIDDFKMIRKEATWIIRCTIAVFMQRGRGGQMKASVSLSDVPAVIRTENLSNMSQEHTNWFGLIAAGKH